MSPSMPLYPSEEDRLEALRGLARQVMLQARAND